MADTNAKETIIVKAAPKKSDETKDDQPRVTVKAAVIPAKQKTQQAHNASEQKAKTKRPPMGTPVVNKDLDNRQAGKPVGTPMPKRPAGTPLKKEEVKKEEVKVETTPVVEVQEEPKKVIDEMPTGPKIIKKAEPKVEAPKEEPKKEEPKAEPKNEEPKAEPKKEEPKKEEVHIGPKIVKRAAEVRAEEEARKAAKKPAGVPQKKDDVKRATEKREFVKKEREHAKEEREQQKRAPRKDHPQRRDMIDKDADERPRQSKPQGGSGRQNASKDGMQRMETKHGAKDTQKRGHVEKDRDKFDKFENGGKKSKKGMENRSLEKAAKPKKHSQYKQVVEEEEVDILEEMPTGTIAVSVPITVGGFCEQADISMNAVIMSLMKMGIMANINQNLDEDTVEILAAELGISVVVTKVEENEVEEGIEDFEDKEEDLKPRAPFVTVMGHVDHGKTSLLDAIRNTNVASGESGGITQHIGASEVTINGKKIVFLDTPGHEAFTAMRARGAHVTDIAVLVVAADDGVMPQTVESISHAKAAGVPIIVAINKIDKPGANPDRVKQELTEHGILVEDWGGDVISVPVSAKKGDGITELLEMILLQAEVLELKANPNRMAKGSVVEARLDKNKGPVATLLVDNGTLRSGQSVVVGNCYGRIRLMTDFRGKTISKAGPATAVEILGLDDVPTAGDEFNAVKDDKTAREIAENRKNKLREEILSRNASSTLEQLFSQIQEGEVKDLNLIVKADVQGSVEAIAASLEKLNNENVRVKIVHTGVGTVNESDVTLASTTGSIIIGFNVRPTTAVQTYADRENVQIRLYRVIYDIINEIEDAMKGMLDPEFKEEVLGKIEVRTTFKVPNVGTIAGAYVTEGKAVRNAEVRLVRDGIVIHEGLISSLKRFKDDAKEVNQGFECGIGIERYNDIKEGDVIECFHMVEVERK